jgi:hypothetical protein
LLTATVAAAQEPAAVEPTRAPEGSRIINLPSADVLAKGSLGVLFIHRFNEPLGDSNLRSFFSLDKGADNTFGISYSPIRSLELSLDRSSNEDDYELAAKYRFLPVAEGRPFAIALRVGGNARTEVGIEDRYAFFAQGIAAFAIGSRVRLTAIPTYVSNTPLFREVFTVPVALSVAVTRSVNLQGEFYPKNRDFTEHRATDDAPARKTNAGWLVAIEKTVLRHRFAFTFGNLRATNVDQYSASDFLGGLPRDDVYLGFNIVRQWKLK